MMSDTDTSAEAVERAVKKLTRLGQIGRESAANSLPITGVTNRDGLNIAAMLRALRARAEQAEAAVQTCRSFVAARGTALDCAQARAAEAEAERDRLRAEVAAQVEAARREEREAAAQKANSLTAGLTVTGRNYEAGYANGALDAARAIRAQGDA
jgi:hypothetical protein